VHGQAGAAAPIAGIPRSIELGSVLHELAVIHGPVADYSSDDGGARRYGRGRFSETQTHWLRGNHVSTACSRVACGQCVDLAARRFGGCRIERRDDTAINSSDHGDHRDRRERVRQCLLAAGGGSGGHRR
jgi:hypothetical protein